MLKEKELKDEIASLEKQLADAVVGLAQALSVKENLKGS